MIAVVTEQDIRYRDAETGIADPGTGADHFRDSDWTAWQQDLPAEHCPWFEDRSGHWTWTTCTPKGPLVVQCTVEHHSAYKATPYFSGQVIVDRGGDKVVLEEHP